MSTLKSVNFSIPFFPDSCVVIPIRDYSRYVGDSVAAAPFSLSTFGGEVAILSIYTAIYLEMLLEHWQI